jgi:hypothetical protein
MQVSRPPIQSLRKSKTWLLRNYAFSHLGPFRVACLVFGVCCLWGGAIEESHMALSNQLTSRRCCAASYCNAHPFLFLFSGQTALH